MPSVESKRSCASPRSRHVRVALLVALAGALLGLGVVAFLRKTNEGRSPAATEAVRADPSDGIDEADRPVDASPDQGPTKEEILRAIQGHVAEVKPIPADADVKAVLSGRFSSTRHVLGLALAGNEFFVFPDGTYFFIHWADVLATTIFDKGQWQYRDGFVVLFSDGSTPEHFHARDRRYLPLLFPTDRPNGMTETRWAEKKELLLLFGADFSFALFLGADHPQIDEQTRQFLRHCLHEDPQFQLRSSTYSKVEPISPDEAEGLKERVFQDCWRPDSLWE